MTGSERQVDPTYMAFEYGDEEGLDDGALIQVNFYPSSRVTRAVYDAFIAEAGTNAGADDLVAQAFHALEQKAATRGEIRILRRFGKELWLVPNEIGGSTLMFPDDY